MTLVLGRPKPWHSPTAFQYADSRSEFGGHGSGPSADFDQPVVVCMSSHLPAPPPSPRAGPRRSPRHLPGMEPHLCWAPPGADAEMPEDAKMLPPPAWEAWAEMVSGTLMAPPPPPAVARAARRNLRVQRRAAASATAALGFISLADASRDQIEAQGLPGRKRPRGWADSHSGSSDSEPRRADEETEMQNFKLDALTSRGQRTLRGRSRPVAGRRACSRAPSRARARRAARHSRHISARASAPRTPPAAPSSR